MRPPTTAAPRPPPPGHSAAARRPRPGTARTQVLAVLALGAAALLPAPARAELVEIAWGRDGRFEHRFELKPGKFAELCGRLEQGTTVRWSYESAAPLNFNIHYHLGKEVVVPVQQQGLARAEGALAVALPQDYCWMWTHKSGKAASLLVQLAR